MMPLPLLMSPIRWPAKPCGRPLRRLVVVFLAIFVAAFAASGSRGEADYEASLPLEQIELPPGFEINLFARARGARSMAFGDSGTLFVGTGGYSDIDPEGRVYAIRDDDRDGVADSVTAIASGLHNPNGVAFFDGDLYVAEIDRILKFPLIETRLDAPPEPVVIYDQFPGDIWHGWKHIAFGPDGKLYVPVGAPCNVCDEALPYASIHRMNLDGTGLEVVALGVRNTVGFDWHPETGQLWFTDNGRDNLGPIPPDELNRLDQPGEHFGFPFCHGDGLQDPEVGGVPCDAYKSPVVELGAHVAALGMTFYDAVQFPDTYRNQIFIAEHGSWNSPQLVGYKLATVIEREGGGYDYQDFATGWLNPGGESRWGRPVDVVIASDGSLLVSDDMAGAIYRIHYTGEGADDRGQGADRHGFIIDDDRNYWDADVGLMNGGVISAARAQLFRVYYGGLGRLPDAGGFAWWSNEIAEGRRTLTTMAAGFLHSAEFKAMVDLDKDGALSSDEVLTHLYVNVLGRQPDPGGYAYWMGELDSGRVSLVDLLVRMTQSNEFVEKTLSQLVNYLPDDSAETSTQLDLVPLLDAAPQYPLDASADGASGHCTLGYSITAGGDVENIEIIDCSPVGAFEQASIEALKQFAYSPVLHKGAAVSVDGLRHRFDYVYPESSEGADNAGAVDASGPDAFELPAVVEELYDEHVSTQVVAERCLACHVEGGIAPGSGARLVFAPAGTPDQDGINLQAIAAFVNRPGSDSALLLTKIRGVAHGGGAQFPASSIEYRAVEQLVALLAAPGGAGDGGESETPGDIGSSGFWSGVSIASREATLRRAALILSGRLPTEAELQRAALSEAGFREAVLGLMQGDGFHEFLIRGANDRLHTDGFMHGLSLEASNLHAGGRYPVGLNYWYREPPVSEAEEEERDRFAAGYQFGLARAPLELIAHVVENDRPYTEILTADYTMVNPQSAYVFNSDTQFAPGDDRTVFKVGRNRGQVVEDEQYVNEYSLEYGTQILAHSGFIQYPHAGILNEPAWLERYPSTETNRNRARARWTYYHFLGVDIEKSASRTTDPDALADTDNPTMKNPACTVCHERLDPVAGAYQNYGDAGFWRSSWGGLDALPDTYKYPDSYDPSAAPSLYQEGDTWYRDMRSPGFENRGTPPVDRSLQWLAFELVDDPRFATAAVAFWWPALMGAEMLDPPEVSSDAGFEQQLRVFEAQRATARELAGAFVANGYRLKQLLADLVLAPWFRADGLDGAEPESRAIELVDSGVDRLLTPEELENKTAALLGFVWGEHNADWHPRGVYTNLRDRFRTYYGGIDSVGIKERSTAMTALMLNVAERQALELGCAVVALDFLKKPGERRLFNRVDVGTTPLTEAEKTVDVSIADYAGRRAYDLAATLRSGSKRFSLSFNNDAYDTETGGDRNLVVASVEVLRDGVLLQRIEGGDFESRPGFSRSAGVDADGNEWVNGGEHWVDVNGNGNSQKAVWMLWSNGEVAFDITLPSAGNYLIRVNAYGTDVGDGVPPSMTVAVSGKSLEQATNGSIAVLEQIQALYASLLGDELPVNHPEIQAVYDLLVETWLDRQAQPDNGQAWARETACYIPGALSDEQWSRVGSDPVQMLYSWTSVMHFLMTHFDYLHE